MLDPRAQGLAIVLCAVPGEIWHVSALYTDRHVTTHAYAHTCTWVHMSAHAFVDV